MILNYYILENNVLAHYLSNLIFNCNHLPQLQPLANSNNRVITMSTGKALLSFRTATSHPTTSFASTTNHIFQVSDADALFIPAVAFPSIPIYQFQFRFLGAEYRANVHFMPVFSRNSVVIFLSKNIAADFCNSSRLSKALQQLSYLYCKTKNRVTSSKCM